MEKKRFIIFNTTSIGDVPVTNNLVRNIKYYYPDSYVIFVCNTPIHDIAKYKEGVDEVINYEKLNSNNLKEIWNFVKNFPYKKPYASFITYANERNLLIARLIGSRHVISHHKFSIWNTKKKYKLNTYVHKNDQWGGLIEPLVGEHKNFPIIYNAPEIDTPIIKKIKNIVRPVPLAVTSNFFKRIFYNGHVDMWGSANTLYPSIMLEGMNIAPQDIITAFKDLVGDCI